MLSCYNFCSINKKFTKVCRVNLFLNCTNENELTFFRQNKRGETFCLKNGHLKIGQCQIMYRKAFAVTTRISIREATEVWHLKSKLPEAEQFGVAKRNSLLCVSLTVCIGNMPETGC